MSYEPIGVSVTPEMNKEMESVVEQGHFLNRSHLIREGVKKVLQEIKAKDQANEQKVSTISGAL